MKTRNKLKRDGRWLDDFVVEDGAEVRVPLHLADGYRRDLVNSFAALDADLHKSGFRIASQASRDAVSSARCEAWRGFNFDVAADARRKPPPDDDDDDGDDEDEPGDSSPRAAAIRARDAWVRDLRDAWRDAKPLPVVVGAGPKQFV